MAEELRVGEEDRVLIEGVVEALGRAAAELEGLGDGKGVGGFGVKEMRRRQELRERLQGALEVLEGEEGGMF